MSLPFTTRAAGKLLLTGEYFVLDGAVALALPVQFGQVLRATETTDTNVLTWRSLDEKGQAWFEGSFDLPGLDVRTTNDDDIARTLQSVLLACRRQNPAFLTQERGVEVSTEIDFPRDWGLGTSSTLIAALGRWADVNPYDVLTDTLGGSGYDIACAYASGPVLYQRSRNRPLVQNIDFQPVFSENLYFVHLGKKQNSREGIRRYRELTSALKPVLAEVDRLTERFLTAASLADFREVMEAHEALVSRALDLPTVKSQLFPDFPGAVKSLGAWGGDFVLAATEMEAAAVRAYFLEKGLEDVLTWGEMVGS